MHTRTHRPAVRAWRLACVLDTSYTSRSCILRLALAGKQTFSFFFLPVCLAFRRGRTAMLQKLVCSPRLVATGGFCADHSSQPLYAHLIDPKFSRTELINHGDLKTFDELRRESEDREAAEHHHFS